MSTALRVACSLLLAVAVVVLLGGAASASGWGWPLAGTPAVTRPFGLGPTPYAPGHRGADLASAVGQPVLAAAPGRVTYAGLLAGRGVLTVTHGALRTTYEPVMATVHVGDVVAAGQPVATLAAGHAGCRVAACLHWGLRRGEDYLDPVLLMRRGPVRLLTPHGSDGPPSGTVDVGAGPAGAAGRAGGPGTPVARLLPASPPSGAVSTASGPVKPIRPAPSPAASRRSSAASVGHGLTAGTVAAAAVVGALALRGRPRRR